MTVAKLGSGALLAHNQAAPAPRAGVDSLGRATEDGHGLRISPDTSIEGRVPAQRAPPREDRALPSAADPFPEAERSCPLGDLLRSGDTGRDGDSPLRSRNRAVVDRRRRQFLGLTGSR